LIGYVQATVYPTHRAAIAYELNSRYWGRGLATAAVTLMIAELVDSYDVETLSAVLKSTNQRSRRLLERIGFSLAGEAHRQEYAVEPDELLMLRPAVVAGEE
jgi:RimJ/RimL family protein N-acetyltransferase